MLYSEEDIKKAVKASLMVAIDIYNECDSPAHLTFDEFYAMVVKKAKETKS